MTEIPDNYVWIIDFLRGFIGPTSRLWPGYSLAALLICFVIYRRHPHEKGFWAEERKSIDTPLVAASERGPAEHDM